MKLATIVLTLCILFVSSSVIYAEDNRDFGVAFKEITGSIDSLRESLMEKYGKRYSNIISDKFLDAAVNTKVPDSFANSSLDTMEYKKIEYTTGVSVKINWYK